MSISTLVEAIEHVEAVVGAYPCSTTGQAALILYKAYKELSEKHKTLNERYDDLDWRMEGLQK